LKVAIIGLGYVGAVTAACLAHLGRTVIGVDTDPHKASAVAEGRSPISEPGLDDLLAEAVARGRLTTASVEEAVSASDVIMIAVGTPSAHSGALDLSAVHRVVEQVASALPRDERFRTVVIRSTVLPGTTESEVRPRLEERLRHAGRRGVRPGDEPRVPPRVIQHPRLLRGQPHGDRRGRRAQRRRVPAASTTASRRRSSWCRSGRPRW
jgi:nucleotide sugar dehydrogenase